VYGEERDFLPPWSDFMYDLQYDEELQSKYDNLKKCHQPPQHLGSILGFLFLHRIPSGHPATYPDGKKILKEDVLKIIEKQPQRHQLGLIQLVQFVDQLATVLKEPMFKPTY